MSEKKSLLIVLSKAPYQGQQARESLDAILTAAAFEQPLSLLFTGEGVYQLLQRQQPEGIQAKNLAATLPVLPLYDVENIYIDQQAAEKRAISASDCLVEAEFMDIPAMQQLFAKHDCVLSF